MELELHHFFILVEPGGGVGDILVSLGMPEGTRNKHEGQGTSNRRFNFSNGTLELLWIHDTEEATKGPGREMRLSERAEDSTASPFGLIFCRKDNTSLGMPFEGWKYQPDYFDPLWAFHIGENSNDLLEPLCVYMPFIEPGSSVNKTERGKFKSISSVHVYSPSEPMSDVLDIVDNADRLTIDKGSQHLMEIVFDGHQFGRSKDLRPELPIIIHW